MNHKKPLVGGALALFTTIASAWAGGIGDGYPTYRKAYSVYPTENVPEFDYATATTDHPLMVKVQTSDGKCQFTIGLAGLQHGGKREVGLTGRIEEGTCGNRGMVRALVERGGKSPTLVTIHRHIEVVVENEDDLDARVTYASEEGYLFALGVSAVAHDIRHVMNDFAVAYQAKCGKPIALSHLRGLAGESEQFTKALAIVTQRGIHHGLCASTGKSCGEASHQAEYMEIVTSVQCREGRATP